MLISNEPKPSQQSTLHAFWSLPNQGRIASDISENDDKEPHCDDCERHLHAQTVINIDLDIAIDQDFTRNIFQCNSCGRAVCDYCAIVTIKRYCLHCSTR
jgi:hypothetical protein